VVRDHNQTLWECTLHPAIGRQAELIGHRFISAYPYRRRCPPLRHSHQEDAKRLLRQGHVRVIEVSVEKIQGRSEELCYMDTVEQKTIISWLPSTEEYMAALSVLGLT
jgi:hypothetical protein